MSANGLPTEQAVERWAAYLLRDEALTMAAFELKRWTRDALRNLQVGYDGERFTIPIRDAEGYLENVIRYAPDAIRENGAPKSLAHAGAPRDLFPAPETIEGHDVFFVEGEPDAITARSAGLPAVGLPGTQGWKSEWAPRFENKTVYVLFDCDAGGRKTSQKVGEDLAPYAASVRIGDLDPSRDDGYDLGDFLADVETPDDFASARTMLDALIDSAPLVTPTLPPPVDGPRLTSAASITPRRMEWLWAGRIPRAAITLLLGMPGLGKSMLTAKIAAETSQRGEGVILCTAEDLFAETVVPRLKAEQAVLDSVHFLSMYRKGFEESPRLPDDVLDLEAMIRKIDAKLVIVDPLAAHFGRDVDSFRDQSVRSALAPLKRIAELTGVVILIVAHLNKGGSTDPVIRAGGSVGIVGAARSALLLERDPRDPEGAQGDMRVLAQAKLNLAKFASSLAYSIEGIWLPDQPDIETAKLVCTGESDYTAQDLLGVVHDRGEATKLEEAIEWLGEELADGPVAVQLLKKKCQSEGFSWRTVEEAKRQIGATAERVGFGSEGIWSWRLPGDPEEGADE